MSDAVEPQTKTLAAVTREHIENVLAAFHGNKSKAAKALGIDRRSLYRYLERWKRADLDPFDRA